MDLLALLNDLVTALAHSPWLFLVVFVVCVVDGFFPPIPSETVVVGAATIAAATGTPHLLPLIAVAAAGAIAGDNLAYAIGRGVGVARWRWMRTRRVAAAFEWARRGLDRRGALLIFTARYIPVGRIAVNMTAGATRFPRARFAAISVAAGITWALYSAVFGVVAGQWLHDQPVLAIILSVVLAAGVGAAIDVILRAVFARTAGTPDPVTAVLEAPTAEEPVGAQAAARSSRSSA